MPPVYLHSLSWPPVPSPPCAHLQCLACFLTLCPFPIAHCTPPSHPSLTGRLPPPRISGRNPSHPPSLSWRPPMAFPFLAFTARISGFTCANRTPRSFLFGESVCKQDRQAMSWVLARAGSGGSLVEELFQKGGRVEEEDGGGVFGTLFWGPPSLSWWRLPLCDIGIPPATTGAVVSSLFP